MFYYEVWVRSIRYKGSKPLTYSYPNKLTTGQIVEAQLQKETVLGVVSSTVLKPRFKVKDITNVLELPPLPLEQIKLMEWIVEFYPSSVGEVSRLILPSKIPKKLILPERGSSTIAHELPKLTDDQEKVVSSITDNDTYLLHGRTGSGKTRIYIEIAKEKIEDGRSSIILTPEISLTSQLYLNFQKQFGNQVILVHSKQTDKERFQSWFSILSSDRPVIVIGPRSALFSPISNLGLIVVDESHESSYKQDQQPYYLTNRVASYLNKISKSVLILGSATPSISDYFLAKQKNKKILEMKKTAIDSSDKDTVVEIIDLKDKSNFTKSKHLSNKLIETIKKSLENKEQSLLFLNRRGTARIIFCNSCGWELMCEHCNLPMTYHGDKHQLICHSCGRIDKKIPNFCPSCKKESLVYSSAGTKAITEEVMKLFPGAKIARYDTDNTKDESIEKNIEAIRDGRVDIIIGTQILAKGLDLPKLTTLGIINADTTMYIPDFSSEERTFQIIAQVLGRINRGHSKGQAVIQTYNPEDKIFRYAINQDYVNFYNEEIDRRQKYRLPPFYNMLKVSILKKSPLASQKASNNLVSSIRENYNNIIIEGPSPAFHEKHGELYEWIIVVKSTSRNTLTSIIKSLPSGTRYDIDPINLL